MPENKIVADLIGAGGAVVAYLVDRARHRAAKVDEAKLREAATEGAKAFIARAEAVLAFELATDSLAIAGAKLVDAMHKAEGGGGLPNILEGTDFTIIE